MTQREAPITAHGAGERWAMLSVICLGVVGVLTTWFSATAIVPELILVWGLTDVAAAWLTNSVQLGFVIGAVGASLFNLPDLVDMRRLMTTSAIIASLANASLLVVDPTGAVCDVCRSHVPDWMQHKGVSGEPM